MKLFFDFFPILLFFIGYKVAGIYYATSIAMATSVIQVVFYRLKHQRYEKMHLISLILIFILGGATLFFHNPWFIKWKPTGIYWLTSLVLLTSSLIGNKLLIQKILGGNIKLPEKIWFRLNYAWVGFFLLMGAINLYVAYSYSTDAWVNFKLFGGLGITFIFIFLQAVYLSKHQIDIDTEQKEASNNSL